MTRHTVGAGSVLALLLAAVLPLAAQDRPACGECHAAQTTATVRRHEPLGCETCHDLSARDSVVVPDSAARDTSVRDTTTRRMHPQRPLLQTGSALCLMCHSGPAMETGVRHVADSLGACSACHDPHGTANHAMVRRSGTALCFGCHTALRDSVRLSRVQHGAIGTAEGCLGCHGPHTAGRSSMLTADQPAMCLSCHSREYQAGRRRVRDVARELREATTVHAPVEAGLCTVCHAPHASRRERLLTDGFEVRVYADYRPRAYELCQQCHASVADTTAETGFRNGTVSLHAVHVLEPGRNRSCYTCHAAHGARNTHLIRASVPFGEWMLPLGYAATANGGRCAPGCHAPAAYSRTAREDRR